MRFFSVFLASLLAAISFHAIPARADWRLEAVGLYSELMELARTGALRDRGFAAAFIPTPFGDVVVVGELLQLAREISSGYRLSGSKAAYAANMSMQWAGVSLCLKMPNSCKLP